MFGSESRSSLRPKTEPDVDGWAEDIDALTDEAVAEIKRTSTLDRSFLTKGPLTWGGRSFGAGETIAVAWVDAARLGLFLTECHRTILPEVEGWDLVSLPPVGSNLGLDREELIRYLGGEGPGPKIEVQIRAQRSRTDRSPRQHECLSQCDHRFRQLGPGGAGIGVARRDVPRRASIA